MPGRIGREEKIKIKKIKKKSFSHVYLAIVATPFVVVCRHDLEPLVKPMPVALSAFPSMQEDRGVRTGGLTSYATLHQGFRA